MCFVYASFKPQRGKFTPSDRGFVREQKLVSNPNGVNLHSGRALNKDRHSIVSNPNGVNLHGLFKSCFAFLFGFKPQRGKFTRASNQTYPASQRVSNPNGVNLHNLAKIFLVLVFCFKPQRGKFTR